MAEAETAHSATQRVTHPGGYDSENERADGETTDAYAYSEAGDWLLRPIGEDDDGDYEDGCATKELAFSLSCVSRRINNGDLTQDEAEALWSEWCVRGSVQGCGEQEFADFLGAVNKLLDTRGRRRGGLRPRGGHGRLPEGRRLRRGERVARGGR